MNLRAYRPLLPGLALLIALGAGGYAWDRRTRPRLLAGPLLQRPAPEVWAVVWSAARGESPATKGRLEWVDSTGARRAADAVAGPDGYIVAHMPTAGPSAARRYRVSGRGWLGRSKPLCEMLDLPVAPGPDRPMRFIVFGDSGNGSNGQHDLAALMGRFQPDLILHTGDLIYPAGAAADYLRNFFVPYAVLVCRAPFMPCLGNHDYGTPAATPYLNVFTLPRNGPDGVDPERNYWFDLGPARFVALDTNRRGRGGVISEQQMRDVVAPWLRNVLRDAGSAWRLVYFHHPPFTGGVNHPAASQTFVREIFVPVLDQAAADVVFCGHNHLYERTAPLHAGERVPPGEGVVYITTGAGGVSLYEEMQPPPPYMESFHDTSFSFTVADLGPDELHLRQIAADGSTIDEVRLPPSRRRGSASHGFPEPRP